jgi:hypothetical protein
MVSVSCSGKAKKAEPGEKAPATATNENANTDSSSSQKLVASKPVAAPAKPGPAPTPLAKDDGEHQGKHLWSFRFGGIERDSVRGVAVDSKGNIAMCGFFSKEATIGNAKLTATAAENPKEQPVDAFVAMLDGNSKPLWTAHLPGKGDQIAGRVAFDGDGNVIVVGWFGVEIGVGDGVLEAAGGDDIFVAKYAPDGRRLWAKRFGGKNIDGADDIAVDSNNGIIITGVFRGEANFGKELVAKSKGNADAYLLKLAPNGEPMWLHTLGYRGDDFGRGLALAPNDEIVLFGEFSGELTLGSMKKESVGNRDAYLARFDRNGEPLWVTTFGNEFDDIAIGLDTDSAGNSIVIHRQVRRQRRARLVVPAWRERRRCRNRSGSRSVWKYLRNGVVLVRHRLRCWAAQEHRQARHLSREAKSRWKSTLVQALWRNRI